MCRQPEMHHKTTNSAEPDVPVDQFGCKTEEVANMRIDISMVDQSHRPTIMPGLSRPPRLGVAS